MPIRIPNDLPAASALQQENIFVMTQDRALTQDIRPLEIVLLNLMPTKIVTETQLSRLLGNTPLQVNLELMHTTSHIRPIPGSSESEQAIQSAGISLYLI